ncbi:MAG: hypothetical protein ACE5JI_03270 [Acidobacteriota bacterium]
MKNTRSLIGILLLVPAIGAGQSLGEVARKEKERRQKNREKDAPVRVIDEAELATLESATSENRPGQPDEGAGSENPESSERAIDAGTSEPSLAERREAEASKRRHAEAEWRGRASQARERLQKARERYEFLNGLHLSGGEYYVDENNRPVITSLRQLRQMIATAKAELEAANRAYEELVEEARRVGVPPGWLR